MATAYWLSLAMMIGVASADVGLPEMGNWTVENCIVLKMAGQLTIYPVEKNSSWSVDVPIPPEAVATGACRNTNETITLNWEEEDSDSGTTLNRNLTVTFRRNDTVNPPMYGVWKVEGVYEKERYVKEVTKNNVTKNETFVKYVSLTTYSLQPYEFQTPVNRSYLCIDVGELSIYAELHDTSEPGGSGGEKLNNATFTAKNVQFDAFRPQDIQPNQLQTPLDCSFKPSDVVPIVVGCALAGTVLLVLIAYMVGRRKNRARGYQSV